MASLSFVVIRRRLGGLQWQVDPSTWLRLVKAAFPFGIIGFTLGLSYKIDTVLLQYFQGNAVTGWYNAAYNLIFMLMTISHAVNVSLYPSMVRQYTTNPNRMIQIYNRALKYMFVLSLPIAAGTTILGDKIVFLLYSEEFSAAILPLRILIWVLPLMFLSELLGNIVIVHSQEHRVVRSIGVSTAVNVILNLVFIPLFGLKAASVITVLTEVILVSQYLWILRPELASIDRVSAFLKPALAAAFMGMAAWAFRGWNLLIIVAISASIYLAGIVLLGVVDKKEVHFLRNLLNRRGPMVLEEADL